MRKIFTIIAALFLVSNLAVAQETMYIFKYGYISSQVDVANVDSIVFYSGTEKEWIADADGNGYKTIKIGTQEWFMSNLKTTKFNDNTAIAQVTDAVTWAGLNTPAYSWYSNDESLQGTDEGALYNWYTVASNKLCPTGWHTATWDDWETLNNFLGGSDVSGGKLKTVTGSGPWYYDWSGNNTGNSNSVGFFGAPAGLRPVDGAFSDMGWASRFWANTEDPADATKGRFKMLHTNTANLWQGTELKTAGYSVRCVKD